MAASLEYAIDRLTSLSQELSILANAEFPYDDAKDLASNLARQVNSYLEQLNDGRQSPDAAAVRSQVIAALKMEWVALPYMGLIHRSIATRNAFEIYAPLKDLVEKVVSASLLEIDGELEDRRGVRIILSSEWAYSPLLYRPESSLDNFVLFGMPAPESNNPFLIPLLGHELGHYCWTRCASSAEEPNTAIYRRLYDVLKRFAFEEARSNWHLFSNLFDETGTGIPDLDEMLSDLTLDEKYSMYLSIVMSQAEETFCDMVALRIFGDSFVKAFAMLLAPSFEGGASQGYPSVATRLEVALACCQDLYPLTSEAAEDLAGYVSEAFSPYVLKPTTTLHTISSVGDWNPDKIFHAFGPIAFLCTLSERSVKKAVGSIWSEAQALIDKAEIPAPPFADHDVVRNHLDLEVPCGSASSCGVVLSAGWTLYEGMCRERAALSIDDRHLESRQLAKIESRKSTLRELLFKNFDIIRQWSNGN